jgi:hypothetical protein
MMTDNIVLYYMKNLSNVDRIKIFMVACLLRFNKKTNDKEYIKTMKVLDKQSFDVTSVPNIEAILDKLNEFDDKLPYEITVLMYLKNKKRNEMIDICRDHYGVDIVELDKHIDKSLMIAKSYSYMTVMKGFKDEKAQETHNHIVRTEVLNRLLSLREYFDINTLKKLEVKLIKYKDAKKMSADELCNYYNSTIKTILRNIIYQSKEYYKYKRLQRDIRKFLNKY